MRIFRKLKIEDTYVKFNETNYSTMSNYTLYLRGNIFIFVQSHLAWEYKIVSQKGNNFHLLKGAIKGSDPKYKWKL